MLYEVITVGNKELEAEIVAKAHEYGMRILGPNIVGTLSNAEKLNASFAPILPLPGKGALVSQSGALLIAMDMATFTRKVGFRITSYNVCYTKLLRY